GADHAMVDAPRLYARVRNLAAAQSADVAGRLAAEGVKVISGHGRLASPRTVVCGDREIAADVVLLATGARPRELPGAAPDGDRVLPQEDADAAVVVEDVFRRRGMTVLSRSRAAGVERTASGVAVTLTDGRAVRGSHCLLTVGMVPNTGGLGLEECGITVDKGGFIQVDRVSRTSGSGVYAAGDCTGVWMVASV